MNIHSPDTNSNIWTPTVTEMGIKQTRKEMVLNQIRRRQWTLLGHTLKEVTTKQVYGSGTGCHKTTNEEDNQLIPESELSRKT